MFFRVKPSGPRRYLQIVENHWHDGRSRQRVVATLGRLGHLQQDGRLEALLASGARFAEQALLLTALHNGDLPTLTSQRLGPVLIFERLWHETACHAVLQELLADRRFTLRMRDATRLTTIVQYAFSLFCNSSAATGRATSI